MSAYLIFCIEDFFAKRIDGTIRITRFGLFRVDRIAYDSKPKDLGPRGDGISPNMDASILDLDGSILAQQDFTRRCSPEVVPLQEWGQRIRLACSFGAFRRFERECCERLLNGCGIPRLTFYGSGDFHHVTLALLRRLDEPFNLLVLDKHPDWMRGVPLLHCGTWLYHALGLPNLQRVFHLGGDLDFDNWFRWLAPWRQLRSGKIVVYPAVRRFVRGRWRHVANEPLREARQTQLNERRLDVVLGNLRADLARHPLYISLDKDVMQARDAIVNWDSGHLELSEVRTILSWFLAACGGRLAGMDILGDWSPVRVQGLLRRALHWMEHPAIGVDSAGATRCNARVNGTLLEFVRSLLARSPIRPITRLAG